MVKVYCTNSGIRATTGIDFFDDMESAKSTIQVYEEMKQKDPVKFDYKVEELD